jgi:hypothetical protein
MKPVLKEAFHHEGRGPELQRVIWGNSAPMGFEYFNPEDVYTPENLRHLILVQVEAYACAGEEVHPGFDSIPGSNAAIVNLGRSAWLQSFNPRHLASCSHFRIMFYDQIFDVICRDVRAGRGVYPRPAAS